MKTASLTLIFVSLLIVNLSGQNLDAEDLIIEGKKIANEGYSSFDKGKLLKARGLFERAINMDPDNEWALYHQLYTDYRLTIYFMQKDDDDNFDKYMDIAEEEGAKLLEKFPDNAEAKALMCSLYGIKISNNWVIAPIYGPKAGSLIKAAQKIEPENPRILLQAGISKYNTPEFFGGDKKEALKHFKEAIEKFVNIKGENGIKPDWGFLDAHAWLGIAYGNNEEYEKSVEVYQKALSVDPGFGWIKYQLLPDVQKKTALNKQEEK